MFGALYGELTPYAWREQDSETDAYSLFHDRSAAMGWLEKTGTTGQRTAAGLETRKQDAPGLWGMNDAGHEHLYPDAELPLVMWFQVGLTPVPAERSMPVQPFLRCAGDAAARIGALKLEAVQVLLPVDGLDASSRPKPTAMPSLLTAGWFVDSDPDARTSARIRLDSGQVPSIAAAAPHMQEWINRLDQEVFVCQSHSVTEHDPLPIQPPFADVFWNGPPLHQTTFHGKLAEWSLDALGWLGGFLADLSVWHCVTTPLLLTVSWGDQAVSGAAVE